MTQPTFGYWDDMRSESDLAYTQTETRDGQTRIRERTYHIHAHAFTDLATFSDLALPAGFGERIGNGLAQREPVDAKVPLQPLQKGRPPVLPQLP